jgi:ribosome-binding factor A
MSRGPAGRGRDAGPTQRQLRVAEQIRHLLAEALLRGEVHDPRLQGVSVTIAEVRISRDLKQATVFATELGQRLEPETRKVLERAAPFLAGLIARGMNLKYAPRLHFVADGLFDEAARMERLLSDALATIEPAAGPDRMTDEPDQA